MISGSLGVFPLLRRCILLHCRVFSSTPFYTSGNNHDSSSKKELLLSEEAAARSEAYRQLENLDFRTATKILFTNPPKRKKFGLDFHLVQLFFACLPSLAVYLVAQYARSDIRRMEAAAAISVFAMFMVNTQFKYLDEEVEKKKKKAEEENKARDAALNPTKEEANKELLEVKIRLYALEETLKEIVDEKIKVNRSDPDSNKNDRHGKVEPAKRSSENQDVAKGFGSSNTTVALNGKIQHKDVDVAGS